MELAVLSRALGHTWKALWPELQELEENPTRRLRFSMPRRTIVLP
jgi:hypothetical protein